MNTAATLQAIAEAFGAESVSISYHRAVDSFPAFYYVTMCGIQLPLGEGPGLGVLHACVKSLDLQVIVDTLNQNRERRQCESTSTATRAA